MSDLRNSCENGIKDLGLKCQALALLHLRMAAKGAVIYWHWVNREQWRVHLLSKHSLSVRLSNGEVSLQNDDGTVVHVAQDFVDRYAWNRRYVPSGLLYSHGRNHRFLKSSG